MILYVVKHRNNFVFTSHLSDYQTSLLNVRVLFVFIKLSLLRHMLSQHVPELALQCYHGETKCALT
jgi:hypothetical protein